MERRHKSSHETAKTPSKRRRIDETTADQIQIQCNGVSKKTETLLDFATIHDSMHCGLLRDVDDLSVDFKSTGSNIRYNTNTLEEIEAIENRIIEAQKENHAFAYSFFTELAQVNQLFIELKKCKDVLPETLRVAESALCTRLEKKWKK